MSRCRTIRPTGIAAISPGTARSRIWVIPVPAWRWMKRASATTNAIFASSEGWNRNGP
jgi:hypothetical protein